MQVRRALGLARDVATKPTVRRSWTLRVRRPANLFQPFNDTWMDRYPGVFATLRHELRQTAEPRVLSFGCSTGEEVFTLRRYLPTAMLEGMDISRANIRDARRRLGSSDPRIKFTVAGSTAHLPSAAYDAVLCMAVFRHGEVARLQPNCCSRYVTFAAFERTITDLVRCLRTGGLLAVEHANFRVADTSAVRELATLVSIERAANPGVPLYGPDDLRLGNQAYGDVVWRKTGTPAPPAQVVHTRPN